MKKGLIIVGFVVCVSVLSGCGQGVGFSVVPQVARSIPADMKILACPTEGNDTVVVQVDIPAYERITLSLEKAIRESAFRHGRQHCPNQRGYVAVILNHSGKETRVAEATLDGAYWTDVPLKRVQEQGAQGLQIQQTPFPIQPPQESTQLQQRVITRSIHGFELGMPMNNAIMLLVRGVRQKRFQPLHSALAWSMVLERSTDSFRQAQAEKGIIAITRHHGGPLTESLTPFSTKDAQEIVLRFYNKELYEISVEFRIDTHALQDALVTKYGQPTNVVRAEQYPHPIHALVWEDSETRLTHAKDGVSYQDKQILDVIRRQTEGERPKNY